MAFLHHRYDPNGRTYIDDTDSSKRRYVSRVGQRNTIDSNGSWVPYVLHSLTNEIQHGYGRKQQTIEFASDRQILKRFANIICSSFKLYVQAYVGGQWVAQPHGTATRNFRENEVYRDGSWVAADGRCTGFLSFPDAHLSWGAQNPYQLAVGLEAGGSNKAQLGFRFRAAELAPATSGQMRFVVELDSLEKLPADWEWIEQYNPIADETRNVGIRVKDFEWRWSWDEAPYRDIVKEDNPDGTMKISIIIGPYTYNEGEWLTVYPDSWGATETSDDCFEDNGTYYDDAGGGIIVGDGPSNIGWTWSNVTVTPEATLNTGSKITVDITTIDGTPYGTLKAVDENPVPAWGSSEKPSDKTVYSTTTVNWDPTSTGDNIDSPELNTMLQQVTDDGWYPGDSLAVVWMDRSSAEDEKCIIESEEGGDGGELTINYTPTTHSFDASTNNSADSSNPVTFTHTCGASATLLVLCVVCEGSSVSDRTGGLPTYNGESMTDCGEGSIGSGETRVEMFYLLNPDTGSAYTISIPNTGSQSIVACASSYISSTGASALDVSNTATGTAANPSVSVTPTVDGAVIVDSFGSGWFEVADANNRTLLQAYDAGSRSVHAQYTIQGAKGSVSMGYTQESDDYAIMAVAFKEASPSSSSLSSSVSSLSSSQSSDSSDSSLSSESSVSSVSSVSSLSSSSESSAPQGTVCWGHVTGVTQDHTRDFVVNWTGSGSIVGSGDTERIHLSAGDVETSEIWKTGAVGVQIILNNYVSGGTPDTIEYRTGATYADCNSAGWNNYVGAFNSDGFVQVRLGMS